MANKKRTKKVKDELVFDPKKRAEFLSGFSKRKQQRKKKAAFDNEIKLKNEMKRIREETKDLKNKFKQSFKPIEDLNNILKSDDENENSGNENNAWETDEVTVTVSSIKPEELTKKNFIGYRRVCQNDDSENEEIDEKELLEIIPGMETDTTKEEKSKKEKDTLFLKLADNCKSEKDVKKLIKQQTKSAMKKSKLVQKKNQMNHKRNVKLSHRKKFKQEKFLKKHKKIPKH